MEKMNIEHGTSNVQHRMKKQTSTRQRRASFRHSSGLSGLVSFVPFVCFVVKFLFGFGLSGLGKNGIEF